MHVSTLDFFRLFEISMGGVTQIFDDILRYAVPLIAKNPMDVQASAT